MRWCSSTLVRGAPVASGGLRGRDGGTGPRRSAVKALRRRRPAAVHARGARHRRGGSGTPDGPGRARRGVAWRGMEGDIPPAVAGGLRSASCAALPTRRTPDLHAVAHGPSCGLIGSYLGGGARSGSRLALAAITATCARRGQAGDAARFGGRARRSRAFAFPPRLRRRPCGDHRAHLAGGAGGPPTDPGLGTVIAALQAAFAPRGAAACRGPARPARTDRAALALIKLVTGGLGVGVSARSRQAGARRISGRDVAEIEEVWHQAPPYRDLFAWLARRRAPAPHATTFRPVMLRQRRWRSATLRGPDPADFAAEWKWDGIRVQAPAPTGPSGGSIRALATISPASRPRRGARFRRQPDGELLLVARPGGLRAGTASFWTQQRLNRKTVTDRHRRCAISGFPALSTTSCATGRRICALPLDLARRG